MLHRVSYSRILLERKMKTILVKVAGQNVWLRKGTNEPSSDEQAVNEVLVKKVYLRPRWGFDILPGEKWLDIGANIGAFAILCRTKGATAVCFEPEPGCYRLLQKNAQGFRCYQYAVTASREAQLTFVKSKNPQNNYRGTVLPVHGYIEQPPVNNLYAGDLGEYTGRVNGNSFDGIKMDIEGSEGALIDNWLLPRCNKLVMEYHTSRDADVENLRRRIGILQDHFKVVKIPSLFMRVLEGDSKGFPPRFDQLIFCKGAK